MSELPPSLVQVLYHRGYKTPESIQQLLEPVLNPESFPIPEMAKAVERLRGVIDAEGPIAIYADRDVDGLTGLAILARSLKTLGAQIHWGSPLKGRGLERDVLASLIRTGARVLILVDCGTGERTELAWLAEQGIDVIVADHHRIQADLPPAFAWIHPGASETAHQETPCGSVMAFKLAEAIWRTYIDPADPARLDYFLYSHLDLVALGILADRVPLVGENRALVWHGLRRLARTTKTGLASLLRFFHLKGDAITVRQASWQIIPLLNAAGRLGQPQWAVNLLVTEDPHLARESIDALLGLNSARRRAQEESVTLFEKCVLEQCKPEEDAVLIATARALEPSVTGLAAQAMVQKFGRPAFLFVEQGDTLVGSGRGTSEHDLFVWVESHQEFIVKFGGHQGAVGLTVNKSDFPALREGLLRSANQHRKAPASKTRSPEAPLAVDEAGADWWQSLQTLEPFGEGFEMPAFELTRWEGIVPRSKRSTTKVLLKSGGFTWPAELPHAEAIPQKIVAVPQPTPKEEHPFVWAIQPE